MAWKGLEALLLFLVLISCQTWSIQSAPLSSYLVSSFTPPDSESTLPFNHIAINNITGDVYIGARERLYQLDSKLNLKHTVDTGLCPSPNDENVNDNKLLAVVITPKNYLLITCGGCDGYCESRSLTNISHDVIRYDLANSQSVITTDDVPTVGAVVVGADFVDNAEGTPNEKFYLFTGVSGGGISFIAKHNLVNLRIGQNIPRGFVKSEGLFKHLVVYKDYLYYFISRENNVYLGRLCRNSLDINFASYTETELQCGSYNMIQSAHIGPAGSQLADSLNIDSTDALLYTVFSNESSTFLCVYKMSDVQQSFHVAVLGCIQGTSTGTTNSYLDDSRCRESPLSFTPPDSVQCTAFYLEDGSPPFIHRYASGTVPLSTSPIITIPDVIPTSIVTTIERHHTVAFIGDTQGYLHKLNIVNGSFGYVYEDVFVGGGSVLQEIFLDESKERLTLATSSDQGSQVLTLELVNCSQYQSCVECIGEDGGNDGDPYCGWCTLEASVYSSQMSSLIIDCLTKRQNKK
ncbi:plexin-B3-like [Strongylocentrotus purpuratus]|uniref:Sema domain-containing protein n=1 Tax=Strongylocentrotus purpuratus TaxID=7668 RepID=A0A7M7NU78_STRPU|nr:plexin-B3-like [Strongylocentrotus purpuratus]